MRPARRRIAAVLPLAVVACAALPDVPSNQCGNGVVESPEDCDTFAPNPSSVCRPKGVIGECRLDCTPRGDGTRPSCPSGWGCDSTSICRAPTGEFQAPSQSAAAGARSLLAGDFDGDGRGDILSRHVPDALGRTTLAFHYFDSQGVLADTREFPAHLISPIAADLDGDGRSDVVFNYDSEGLGLMLGRADRAWVPKQFGGALPVPDLQVVNLYDVGGEGVAPLAAANPVSPVYLATLGDGPGVYGVDAAGAFQFLAPLAHTAGAFVATGNVIEGTQSPCREVVVAFMGDTTFTMLDLCSGVDADGYGLLRDQALASVIKVPAPIDAAPVVVDFDGDGHLDVLIRANGHPYVAFGDGRGLTSEVSSCDLPLLGLAGSTVPFPLAAGDFTGDGAVDFVFPYYLIVSGPPGGFLHADESCAGSLCYHGVYVGLGKWTEAIIADLNGDGLPDVAAASAAGIDFFNGTGMPLFGDFSEPSQYPVSNLVVADVDGDSINDLGFVEKDPSGENQDSLMMTFGNRDSRLAAPVVVANIANISQLVALPSRFTPASDLVAISREPANAPMSSSGFEFLGSSDRVPIAPYFLPSLLIGLAAGRFTGGRPQDVLALLESGVTNDDPFGHVEFWLVPTLASQASDAVRLDPTLASQAGDAVGLGALNPRLHPFQTAIASASGDLDGDGRDEAIFAMPDITEQQCGLVIATVASATATALARNESLFIDQPCIGQSPQVLPVDADSDGSLDIAILTDRALEVLWNDGHGRFAIGRATVIAGNASALAFAALAPTPASPLRFAYVTDGAAWLVGASAVPRQFGSPQKLLDLQHGTGIAATDVNGDGVTDLAVAASGNLMILKARLESQ